MWDTVEVRDCSVSTREMRTMGVTSWPGSAWLQALWGSTGCSRGGEEFAAATYGG